MSEKKKLELLKKLEEEELEEEEKEETDLLDELLEDIATNQKGKPPTKDVVPYRSWADLLLFSRYLDRVRKKAYEQGFKDAMEMIGEKKEKQDDEEIKKIKKEILMKTLKMIDTFNEQLKEMIKASLPFKITKKEEEKMEVEVL